jgi:hypothetical protein
MLEYQKQYQIRNNEKINARQNKHRETLTGRYSVLKSKGKVRNIDVDITINEYKSVLEIGFCHYCGNKLGKTGSGLDRKNNERVYNLKTVVPCCYRCNSTFMDHYNYEEKMILAEAIKQIDERRVCN